MKPYFCANCDTTVELDIHGRCGNCGSNAVDIASREKAMLPSDYDLALLEALWIASQRDE